MEGQTLFYRTLLATTRGPQKENEKVLESRKIHKLWNLKKIDAIPVGALGSVTKNFEKIGIKIDFHNA